MSRGNFLVRAAQVRALFTAHLNSLSEPVTATDMLQALKPQLDELGVLEATARKSLQVMGHDGLVDAIKEGYYVKYAAKGRGIPQGLKTPVSAKVVTERKPRVAGVSNLIDTLTIGEAKVLYRQLKELFG